MSISTPIREAAEYINKHLGTVKNPIGIILGTGLGEFASEIEDAVEVPYSQIPHFPQSTFEGHDGKLIHGRLEGQEVLAMKGRFHFYEGYGMEHVVFPIRVMKYLNARFLLLSNASGGVNPDFKVGDIMVIEDHINLFPSNPLIGPNDDEMGPRFPDMSEPYDHKLNAQMHVAASQVGIPLKKGVYVGVSGPCFETPAEYKYIRIIGGDTVGMSTVPENIAARHLGIPVTALSVITDLGIEGHVEEVSHEEVQRAAQEAEPKMAKVVRAFFANLS